MPGIRVLSKAERLSQLVSHLPHIVNLSLHPFVQSSQLGGVAECGFEILSVREDVDRSLEPNLTYIKHLMSHIKVTYAAYAKVQSSLKSVTKLTSFDELHQVTHDFARALIRTYKALHQFYVSDFDDAQCNKLIADLDECATECVIGLSLSLFKKTPQGSELESYQRYLQRLNEAMTEYNNSPLKYALRDLSAMYNNAYTERHGTSLWRFFKDHNRDRSRAHFINFLCELSSHESATEALRLRAIKLVCDSISAQGCARESYFGKGSLLLEQLEPLLQQGGVTEIPAQSLQAFCEDNQIVMPSCLQFHDDVRTLTCN